MSARVGHDRVLTTTWRSHWLLELKAKGEPCYKPINDDEFIEKSAAVDRCMGEYFKSNKVCIQEHNIIYIFQSLPNLTYFIVHVVILPGQH